MTLKRYACKTVPGFTLVSGVLLGTSSSKEDPEYATTPNSFKKLRCDEEHVSRHSPWATAEGAVHKQTRERRKLRDQAGCGLERGSSRMSILALKSVFS